MTIIQPRAAASFWKGRRVLVTGHTGFKGGWLSLWLIRQGAVVSGFALPPETELNLFEAARVGEQMDSGFVDIREAENVAAAVKRIEPEIIFHLAAQPLVRHSYQEPIYTFAVNVMGTVHVLEAARAIDSVRVIVVVTSDKCYENRNWLWPYREGEPMGGYDPYSSSKGCAELVTAAWRKSFFQGKDRGVAVASARAGNVIGGGDWAKDRLVPDCVRAFEAGRPVTVRYPDAVRPWQHVLEPLHGYMRLAEELSARGDAVAEGWNFGPGEDDVRPVGWMVDRMSKLWGGDAGWKLVEGEQPHEAAHLRIDSSKARVRLGWQPVLRLDTALEWTIDWHRRHARDGALNVSVEQIDRYEALALATPSNVGVSRRSEPS
jgi:CDP-glucose 4,6-dehydratase